MKEIARRQVFVIAGRALLMLPVLMAAWYFAWAPLTWIPGQAALPIVRAISGGEVSLSQQGSVATYTVKLEMPYRPGATPRVAADVEVQAAKFTYGIAFFFALVFAAKESRDGVGIVFGSAMLLVMPAIGMAFDALTQLGLTPGLGEFLQWASGTRDAVALGYQVGTLLLPTLGPIAIWLWLARAIWAPEPATGVAPAGPGT